MGKKQLFSMIIPIKWKIEFYDDITYKVFKNEKNKNGEKGLVEVESSSEFLTI